MGILYKVCPACVGLAFVPVPDRPGICRAIVAEARVKELEAAYARHVAALTEEESRRYAAETRAEAAETRVRELEAVIEANGKQATFTIDEERRVVVTTQPTDPLVLDWEFGELDWSESVVAAVRSRAKPGSRDAILIAARDELIRRGLLEAKR